MKYILAIFILSISTIGSFAQLANPHFGSRSAAMGDASVTNTDIWAVHHNQAAMAFIEESGVGVGYQNRFLVKELAVKGLVGAFKTKFGTFGVNVSQFGYSQYNENKFGLGYAMKLSPNLSAGIQFNYQYFSFSESTYGSAGVLTTEFGVLGKLTDELTIGAHIYNLNYAKIADYDDEHLPMIFRLGAGYEFSEKFVTNLEVEKGLETDANVKIGAEYKIVEQIAIRGGINTYPFSNSFGFGFNHKGLQLDIAAAYQSTLGYSPQASLQFNF